jgi:phosphoglycolate phosphatase
MNILLDLDGTLTDPKVGILTSLQYALEKLGEDVPPMDELSWCIGPPLKDAFIKMFGEDQTERVAEGVRHFRERFGDVGLFENEVYPDIPELLSRLNEQGHVLHIATSKPEVFARRILDHFNLAGSFASIHGSKLDGTRSDKGELIAYIVGEQSIEHNDSVMIGDRKHDILGAINNDVPGVGVLWGYGSRDELEGAGATACIQQPNDLIQIISEIE